MVQAFVCVGDFNGHIGLGKRLSLTCAVACAVACQAQACLTHICIAYPYPSLNWLSGCLPTCPAHY